MEKGRELVSEVFGNKLRVRVSGICLKEGKILLINHKGINPENEFWAPPGGGMDFGRSAEENLIREFKEETGLAIRVMDFLCVNEFIGLPLHAVELFFYVEISGGELRKGTEPELAGRMEVIKEVEFKSWNWIKGMPPSQLHHLFSKTNSLKDLLEIKGYFLQKKNK